MIFAGTTRCRDVMQGSANVGVSQLTLGEESRITMRKVNISWSFFGGGFMFFFCGEGGVFFTLKIGVQMKETVLTIFFINWAA